MIQQQFIKDQEFILSAPWDYGIDPPPGKTPEDFICWKGCDPAEVSSTCLTTILEDMISAYSKVTYTNINKIPCYYPVWNKYGWTQEQLSTEFFLCKLTPTKSRSSTSSAAKDVKCAIGYYKNNNGNAITAYLQMNKLSICEGGKIGFYICNGTGKSLNNVYLNNQLFAGIDVDTEYWLDHKNDLYRLLPDSLSNAYHWTSPLSTTAYKKIEFNITSCHVSSDNLMHLSCDVDTIGGTVNLYESLDESL